MKYLWLLAALVLAGCGTTGKSIQTELVIRDNTNCTINLYPMLETSSGDNATTSANKTDTLLKDLIKLPDQISAATNALEGAISGAAASGILAEVVGSETTTPVIETISLRPIDNRSFEWLPETGAAYGKNVLFVFDNDCGELLVPDGAVSYGANGNPADFAQTYYFCGTDFAAGTPEYNNGRASIFTRPGCVSTKVTITRQ